MQLLFLSVALHTSTVSSALTSFNFHFYLETKSISESTTAGFQPCGVRFKQVHHANRLTKLTQVRNETQESRVRASRMLFQNSCSVRTTKPREFLIFFSEDNAYMLMEHQPMHIK
jgi:hypothetical protein